MFRLGKSVLFFAVVALFSGVAAAQSVDDVIANNIKARGGLDKIKAVRAALAGSDLTRVRTAADDLERTMQRIGQEVYSQPGTTAGAGTAGAAPGGEPGTVEGEYREV